jgi:heat shock protein HtpX
MLENLCISRGMVMPSFQIIESPQLNAFASGLSDKQSTITLTTGIIESLTPEELEAVIAHELTHIINRDTRLMVVAIIFAGMFSFLAQMFWRNMRFRRGGNRKDGRFMLIAAIVLAIGYLLSIVIRFSLSRRREFMADAGAVELTRNPAAMMNALLRISGRSELREVNEDMRPMLLDDPASGFFGLFATHPAIEDRVAAISAISGEPVPNAAEPKGPWG